MPLILPGNVASATAGAYEVANSCRFNDDDGAMLELTPGSTSDAIRQTWTFSVWFKLGNLTAATLSGTGQRHIYMPRSSSSVFDIISIKDDNKLRYYSHSSAIVLETNALIRDPSAWYHWVIATDTTQGVAANRVKMYLNGTQITSFSTETYPDEDYVTRVAMDAVTRIGNDDTSNYFDGYLAEVALVTGSQLAPTSFGEFDSDSPTIWKPIDISGLTFGTNGFYLDFEDSSNLGNDASGGTDWSETNLAAVDQATDTPTNNFCVMNPLDNYLAGSTFAEGNLLVTTPSSGYNWNTGTFGLTSGKWYFEMFIQTDPTNNNSQIGVAGRNGNGGTTSEHSGKWSDNWVYSGQGDMYNNDTRTGTGFAEASANDIMGCYLDLDNNKVYWALNGTLQNSGTGIALDAPSTTTLGAYFPMVGDYYNGSSGTFRVNFGNPIWSLSSGVADANGYGSFEYDPSAGSFDSASKDFLAICTKNLGSDGG